MDNKLIEFNDLFSHWMTQIETNDQYKELSTSDVHRIQENSKEFLSQFIQSTPTLSKVDANVVKPFLEFLRNIRKIHEQQGLSIRDTTILTLSLKSSLNEYIKTSPVENPLLEELNNLLDVFSILSFELYSHEQEKRIGQQIEQINYLQHASDNAFGELIGTSDAMKMVYQAIGLVLENDVTVLLQGDSGTGKDIIANVIHKHSSRKKHPFIAINCGSIPENLIESELFGHEKGAFTGADQQRIGKFELADNGTIFLDEISEISLAQQTKLLRVIQNQEIQRVGGSQTIPINVRIIAASNKPLEKLVAAEKFRLDLFYRVNVFPIHIPSLSKRGNDIILLANYFIEKYRHILNTPASKLDSSAVAYLLSRSWPGNIRELENIIQRALIIANGRDISDAILSFNLGKPLPQKQLSEPNKKQLTTPATFVPTRIDSHEKSLIINTLNHFNWNIKKAAESLGVSRTTLYNKFNKYNIKEKN